MLSRIQEKAMNRFARKLASFLIVGGVSIGAWTVGDHLVANVRFARAEQEVQASREQLSKVEDFANVYRTVGKAVEPSVVSIEVHKQVKSPLARGMRPEDLLRRFRNFGGDDDNAIPDLPKGRDDDQQSDGENAPTMEQVATGSGVIMEAADGTGYILTNNHVAGGAEKMTITLSDGRRITKARTLGADPKSDLAVVKIEADRLIAAKWGDSESLQKGDIIMAFGSPFGFVGSMTHGIVSALNRQARIIKGDFAYENFIQVDAPINPGNSGGPLVDIHGNVVGINTAIATENGGFMGVGFAIPANQAKLVYQQIKETGKVVRGYIGVKILDVQADPDLVKSFGYNGDNGALVEETYSDTPATGKLHKGDIVSAINGKSVRDGTELRNMVASIKPGTEASFNVFRNGKQQEIKIKIGEQPEDLATIARGGSKKSPGSSDDAGATETSAETLGLKLTDPTPAILDRVGLPADKEGAVIASVKRDSPFYGKVVTGDLITAIGGHEIHNAGDAKAALSKQDLSKGIRMYVTSVAGARFVYVRAEK